ncbi:exodeoxyribonuclease III [Lysobacter humi (ex Lee et al. 2017)]
MARLKVATYNINGIRARLGALLEWLDREQPDVVCLQELKAPDEAFPAGDIEARGYGAIWHGQKSWNGVALLARGAQPVERRRGLPRDPAPEQSRYLEAEIHGLVVGALYLPNGNPWPGPKFDYKLAWFERLIAHARGLLDEGGPVVLAGDYNVVPTDELDIYDPKSWRKDALLQPESREAWFRLLAQGWTDSVRAVHGDAKIFTFWDYFRKHWERDAGLRIDHLLLSPALAPMLADAGVDRWVRGRPGASDHAPTWVLLDTGSAGAGRSKAAVKRRVGPAAGDSRQSGAVAASRRRRAEPSADGGDTRAKQASSAGPVAGRKTPAAPESAPADEGSAGGRTRTSAAKKALKRPVAGKQPANTTGPTTGRRVGAAKSSGTKATKSAGGRNGGATQGTAPPDAQVARKRPSARGPRGA